MKNPMTPKGYRNMREELIRLKAQRPELARAIETARAHGDLSENADYDAAKNRSGMIEAKIRDLESKLSLAEIIDPTKISSTERVVFGTSVRVVDLDSDQERVFAIVGADESDIERGMLSYQSPIGKALIGKSAGDVVKVTLPGGMRELEITEIFVDCQESDDFAGDDSRG